jgi:glyoxylase-like metal-dependent hydrolase (beta-lactamase superfamily II)
MIDLGDRRFTVLHTPGHSWGSICLWETATGSLFCADTVYEGELFDFLPCSHVPTYTRTLRRLRGLPIRVAYPGHGPALDPDAFRAVIDAYLTKQTDGHDLSHD